MLYFTGLGMAWLAVHLIGLLASWMVRMHTGSRYELLAQGTFFVSLTVVAGASLIGYLGCVESWPVSAGVLASMIILVVVDVESETSLAARAEV